MTKQIHVKNLLIGGNSPISIQSMTNTDTKDINSTLAQIDSLVKVGCDLVRVSVPDVQSAKAIRALVDKSPIPVVADIHFDYKLALLSMENGVHKLRLNPGNVGTEERISKVVSSAKFYNVPIRIGVNSGSLEKDILEKEGGPSAKGMVDSALRHIRLLEKYGFYNIVISLKSSNVPMTVEAYRAISKIIDYPLHLGVTEAGLPGQGNIKSAIAIGSLLLDGIGDTVRVSLTGSPIPEIQAAKDILSAVGLLKTGVELISCPTCARTDIDVEGLAKEIMAKLSHVTKPIKIAVMGCVVNGPGEAKEADIGIAGGKNGTAVLFLKNAAPRKITGDIVQIFIEEVNKILKE